MYNNTRPSGQRILTYGRIAGGGADFHAEQCNATPISREHCSRMQQLCCHAVIEVSMIPFAAYTAAETPSAFQLAG